MKFSTASVTKHTRVSIWPTPLCLAILAMILVTITLYLDHHYVFIYLKTQLDDLISSVAARDVLSVISTAIITITSVTFSITVLILSIASNQLGPRLIPNFMRQRTTQLVLGLFIGTFIYTILTLFSMGFQSEHFSMPLLSIATAILLSIICFFVLIYFIHFVCHAIDVDNVLNLLASELSENINHQYPCKQQNNDTSTSLHTMVNDDNNITAAVKNQNKYTLTATNDGYLQFVNYKELCSLAKKHDLILNIEIAAGKFILTDSSLMIVYSDNKLNDHLISNLESCFLLGKRRSSIQDIEFTFEQISEVAVRALSPGINAPYVAIHCIDRIIQGLALLREKTMHSHIIFDDEQTARIYRKVSGYSDFVETAFSRFRQQMVSDLAVSIHAIKALNCLSTLKLPTGLRNAVTKQAEMIYDDVSNHDHTRADREDLDTAYNDFLASNKQPIP